MNTKTKLFIVSLITLLGIFAGNNTVSAGRAPVVTCNSATIYGSVWPSGGSVDAWLEWGNNRNTVQNGGGAKVGQQYNINYYTEISAQLTGLAENTTYYYRMAVQDGADYIPATTESFTTLTCQAQTYTISTNVTSGSGSFSPSSRTVTSGNTTSFSLIPSSGYSIGSASGCNGYLSGNTYYTGTITSNCTINGNFTANPPTTCQDPNATNYRGSLPCTYAPTICQDPNATNYGGRLPCTYQQITVNIYADNQNVSYGNSTNIRWTTTGSPTSCTASGGWSGNKNVLGGYQSTGNLYSNTTYNITCSKGVGSNSYSSDSASVTVSVGSQPIMSGFLNLNPTSCVIASGNNNCNVNLAWSTTNPQGTSFVASSYPSPNSTIANGNSGSQSVSIPWNSRTFYLYNNGILLDQASATASCVSGTSWNGNVCSPIISNPTVNLTADNSNVNYNGATYVRWTSQNAISCTASGGTNGWAGSKTTGGNFYTGNLTNTTTYNITCTNGAGGTTGGSANDSVTVTVGNQPQIPTVRLTANPTSIQSGSNSTLSWTSTNATSCFAYWTQSTATNGSGIVVPTSTTTYNITCTNNIGQSASDSVIVYVTQIPNPTVNLTADNSNVNYNGATYVRWTSQNAISCTASGGTNGWAGSKTTGGNFYTGNLTNTTTYNITCTNGAGSASYSSVNDSVMVIVGSQPINGGWSDWSTQSTQCGYSGIQTRSCNNPSPANGGAYCSGASSQSYTNAACPNPNPYVKLTADNSNVTYNGNTILRWSATNATLCTASGTSNYWYGNVGVSGPWNTGALTNTTTYNITCNGASGTTPATDSVTVYVGNQPLAPQAPTVTLLAYPPSIQYGASSILTWVSTNATSCSGSGTNNYSTSGSMVVSPFATTTYSIICTGTGGSASGTAIVYVNNNQTCQDPSATNYRGTLPCDYYQPILTCRDPNATNYRGTLPCNYYYQPIQTCQDPSATNYRGVLPCNYYNYQTTSVTLIADRTSIAYNENTIIRWYPINAASCYASGGSNGWTGARSIYSNTFNTGPLASTTTYNIFCTNNNGISDTKSVTVFVGNQIINNQPTVNLSADETSVAYNGTTFIRWYTTNATSCYASDGSVGWAGTKSIGPGSFYTGSLTSGKTYSITCTNNVGSVTDSATVSVRPQTIVTPTTKPTPTSLVLITSSVDRNQPIVPTIDNTRPKPGDEINYTVNYQNVGTGAITNLTLRMDLPYEINYMFSTPSNPTVSGNTLIFNLGTLRANGQGTATVRVRVRENIPDGTNLNFPAILSYTDPSGFLQSVSANVSAQVWSETTTKIKDETVPLGALAFLFGNSFLPNSLLGWLLLILLIVLLIMAGRKAYYSYGYGSNTTTISKTTTST